MRMRLVTTSILAVLIGPPAAVGQPLAETAFELKGYHIGMNLDTCPGPESQPAVGQLAGATNCVLEGINSLGGTPVRAMFLTLWQGQVISVGALLVDKGRAAGAPLVAALIEKYGLPARSKPHINEYMWAKPGQSLSFDGYAGTLVGFDTAAHAALRRANATKNKSDL